MFYVLYLIVFGKLSMEMNLWFIFYMFCSLLDELVDMVFMVCCEVVDWSYSFLFMLYGIVVVVGFVLFLLLFVFGYLRRVGKKKILLLGFFVFLVIGNFFLVGKYLYVMFVKLVK